MTKLQSMLHDTFGFVPDWLIGLALVGLATLSR